MQKQLHKIILVMVVLFVGTPSFAFAANLFFEPAKHDAVFNDLAITAMLNTQGESVNAVEGEVKINPQLGAPKLITDTGSIISYWIERPNYNAEKGLVRFSGSLPGGYKGGNAILFTMIFPKYSGSDISDATTFENEKILKSDGLGSRVKSSTTSLQLKPSALMFDGELSKKIYLDFNRKDNVPPEVFTPTIARDNNVYNGHWFISFNTTDKQSGIDHYEIQETKTGRIVGGGWKIVESPYLLEDQELQSYIYIIAIDRQGNERVIKVFPKHPQSWLVRNKDFLIASFIVLLIVAFIQKRSKKRKRAPNMDQNYD